MGPDHPLGRRLRRLKRARSAPDLSPGEYLEIYTKVMELSYWGSTVARKASYGEAKREQSVVVERNGEEITLRPKKLVFALGVSGYPNMPEISGAETFLGEQHHSSQHTGPEAYKGKKCVVLGSNNPAHDNAPHCGNTEPT